MRTATLWISRPVNKSNYKPDNFTFLINTEQLKISVVTTRWHAITLSGALQAIFSSWAAQFSFCFSFQKSCCYFFSFLTPLGISDHFYKTDHVTEVCSSYGATHTVLWGQMDLLQLVLQFAAASTNLLSRTSSSHSLLSRVLTTFSPPPSPPKSAHPSSITGLLLQVETPRDPPILASLSVLRWYVGMLASCCSAVLLLVLFHDSRVVTGVLMRFHTLFSFCCSKVWALMPRGLTGPGCSALVCSALRN